MPSDPDHHHDLPGCDGYTFQHRQPLPGELARRAIYDMDDAYLGVLVYRVLLGPDGTSRRGWLPDPLRAEDHPARIQEAVFTLRMRRAHTARRLSDRRFRAPLPADLAAMHP